MRAGIGFDAHRFVDGRPFILGGVAIEHSRGLAGHSDADVLAHAIVDAILGAAGRGDIGMHFDAADERWRNASSEHFLRFAAAEASAARLTIANIDATVICEAPALSPYRDAMRESLAATLVVPSERVSVKATTTDGMGFTGRGEGIAALAVALLIDVNEAVAAR